MNTRVIICAVLLLFLFAVPGINHGLWLPDEPRVAGICSEMARTRDFVVPKLNGQPFLEKPPLYYSAGAIVGTLAGIDRDIPYRIVSLTFGILTLLVTFFFMKRRYGFTPGLVAAGILATTWEFFHISRWILVDNALVFGVAVAVFTYLELTRKPSVGNSVLLGLGIGISFLAKGAAGPAIIASGIGMDIILRRDWKTIRNTNPFLVILTMTALILPWIGALYGKGGWPFVREIIVVNNIMRFTGAPEGAALGHQHGMFYYLDLFPRAVLPWTLLFIPAFVSSIRHYRENPYLGLFLGPFVLLTIASTKRGIYLTPLLPAVACMVTHWLMSSSFKQWESYLIKATWLIAILGCVLPFSGIFMGQALLGILLGGISLTTLFMVRRKMETSYLKPMLLVALMYVGLIASTTVYFSYMTPHKDFLRFGREAVRTADGRELHVLKGDELFSGLLPMITGKTHQVIDTADTVPGLYMYATRYSDDSTPFPHGIEIDILIEKKVGNKRAVLAEVLAGSQAQDQGGQDLPEPGILPQVGDCTCDGNDRGMARPSIPHLRR